jgi:predicted negative regulator of RcsB-dependent stress response
MIIISFFLIAAALFISYDAWQAYNRMKATQASTAPAE